MDTVKPVLIKVSQVSEGKDKERLLETSEFVTEQMNDPYCSKVCKILGAGDPSSRAIKMEF